MKISQYTYFAIRSKTITAANMTRALGIEPDRLMLRGSWRPDPPVPVSHAWEVICRDQGMTVDQQVERILQRLLPHVAAIRTLTEAGMSAAALQVVRYFNDDSGEEEQLSPPDAAFQKLEGQHQLLGWHLDRPVTEFLTATGAELDVDEYG